MLFFILRCRLTIVVLVGLPTWCKSISAHPCAAPCVAAAGALNTPTLSINYVLCLKTSCTPSVISGSATSSWADCDFGRRCVITTQTNVCSGCSTVNQRLRLFSRNETANTFQCISMPQSGGMAPIGIVGNALSRSQALNHSILCGENFFAPEGHYCAPCRLSHTSSPGARECTPCSADTARVPLYDLTQQMADQSWDCAQHPDTCQPWGTTAACAPCQEGWQSNPGMETVNKTVFCLRCVCVGGLCVDCPGAYTLDPLWKGTTPQAINAGLSPCVGYVFSPPAALWCEFLGGGRCPVGEIRRLSTAECVNCGSHLHIVRVLPAAGTRLTYQEAGRYGIQSYILPQAVSHSVFESLYCDFSVKCPPGSVTVPVQEAYRFCAACPPGMIGLGCTGRCGWNEYSDEWGPNNVCRRCPPGTHAPIINHNRDMLRVLFSDLPVWAGTSPLHYIIRCAYAWLTRCKIL